jgi:hypothetical protein
VNSGEAPDRIEANGERTEVKAKGESQGASMRARKGDWVRVRINKLCLVGPVGLTAWHSFLL